VAPSEDIKSVILSRLKEFDRSVQSDDTGKVLSVGDGVARVFGLSEAFAGEVVLFPGDLQGLVFNLDDEGVGIVVLGPDQLVRQGDEVRRTSRLVEVPVGDALRGRVVDALGRPVDGRGPVNATESRPVEFPAPGIVEREPVDTPLETGIKAVDSLVPIGRGQRELVIGDRGTGKTALTVDAIINQRGKDVYCVYVGIGQRESALVRLRNLLEEMGALDYTTIVAAPAEDPPSLQYLAPYSGCAMAERHMYSGGHALVVYDDLSRHAIAYRAMSLLLRRPPGREAYPGDIFYLHARLLERAARLSRDRGGGSMTALPVVTTLAGDISAYIPTNIISITDGQIYLESELFFAGIRPAINVGLSVSRVGGAAQPEGMRRVTGRLRLELAQYRELQAFSRFASELDPATRARLERGERIVAVLKQPQNHPVLAGIQIALVYAVVNGFLDKLPTGRIEQYERELAAHLKSRQAGLLRDLAAGAWSDATEEHVRRALREFGAVFSPGRKGGEHGDAGRGHEGNKEETEQR